MEPHLYSSLGSFNHWNVRTDTVPSMCGWTLTVDIDAQSPIPTIVGCLPVKASAKDLSIVFVLIMASEIGAQHFDLAFQRPILTYILPSDTHNNTLAHFLEVQTIQESSGYTVLSRWPSILCLTHRYPTSLFLACKEL
jgi:hypothetical protein